MAVIVTSMPDAEVLHAHSEEGKYNSWLTQPYFTELKPTVMKSCH